MSTAAIDNLHTQADRLKQHKGLDTIKKALGM
jgi:hypothetical protein